jgi:hypothetical protein
MDKFDFARVDNGIDAWTNSGKLASAQTEFSNRIQGKSVSKSGIERALIGLKVWQDGWGYGSRTVAKVEWVGFYASQGLAKVTLYNSGSMKTSAQIHWNPEKNVIKAAPKTNKDLEKRVSDLEAQVAMLVKALAAKN